MVRFRNKYITILKFSSINKAIITRAFLITGAMWSVLSDIINFTTSPVVPVVTPIILSIVWLLFYCPTENNKILEATVPAFSSSLFSLHHEALCKGFRT